jgi:anti-sigma B factor antagonist
MQLTLSVSSVAGHPVLAAQGEIDLATVPQLRDALLRLVDDRAGRTVLVDLDGVALIDDVGLGILLGAAARARDSGGDLELVCTDARLLQRFALSGLDRAIHVRPSIAVDG